MSDTTTAPSLPEDYITTTSKVESTAVTPAAAPKTAAVSEVTVPVKNLEVNAPEKPVKLKREKHIVNSACYEAGTDGASTVTVSSTASSKKLKSEAKEDLRKATSSVQSPSNFFNSLSGNQISAANALSAYSASYLQSLQGLGFSAYPTLFADPSQSNPFLPSVAAFGLNQSSADNLKSQEAFLKSLTAASGGFLLMSNGVHASAASSTNNTPPTTTTASKATASSASGSVASGGKSQPHPQTASASNGHDKEKQSDVGGVREQTPATANAASSSSVAQILSVMKGSLSTVEMASLKQLIVGYREAAALLLKSADELENVLDNAGCKI